MHAQPPRTLKRLLKQYGQELIDDPRRTEALLRDHCGQHTREIFVLVNAQKQRIPSELLSAPTWMPRQATYARLARQLQSKLALTEDAANWAVTSWAAALELDSLPKGDGWSWLPSQLRASPPPSKSKSSKKKRQSSSSSVQSSKASERNAARKARERSARAEMGWTFPKQQLASLSRLVTSPVNLSNLLPWVALLTATVFLLAVVYWTSTQRAVIERGMSGLPTAAEASSEPIVGENAEEGAEPAVLSTLASTNVTPLPELPAPAGDYLNQVMPPPIWANVNADDPLLVRQDPSTDSPYLGVLQDGDPVSVQRYSVDGLWSQIDSPFAGWVNNEFLQFLSPDGTNRFVALNVQLRHTQPHEVAVHAQPDTNAEVTATLDPNQTVIVAAELGAPALWYQIADPVAGWITAGDLENVSP